MLNVEEKALIGRLIGLYQSCGGKQIIDSKSLAMDNVIYQNRVQGTS